MQMLAQTTMKLHKGDNLIIKKFDSNDIKTSTKNLVTGELIVKKEPLHKHSTSMIGYQHQLELFGYKEVRK